MADHAEPLLLACRAGSRACRRARRAAGRTSCRCARTWPPSGMPSASITPPRYQGWLAITPTARPSMRAEARDHVARPALGHLEHRAVVHERPRSRRARRRPRALRRARTSDGSTRRHRRRAAVRRILAGAAGGRKASSSRTSAAASRSSSATNWQTPFFECTRGPPSSCGVDVLAHDLAHDARAGQEHRRALGHHHEVGERRRVRAAAGRHAGDDRDLRDAARQPHALAEDAPVAAERRDAVVHARPARCDEADHRRAGAPGELASLARSCRRAPRPASRRRTPGPGRSSTPGARRPCRAAPTTPSPGCIRFDSRRGSTVERITCSEPGSHSASRRS